GSRVRCELAPPGHDSVVTRIGQVGATGGDRSGMHDHDPRHGGVVSMVGMLHLEAVAVDGAIRVYLTDVRRQPVAPTKVTGTVTIHLPHGPRTLPLVVAGEGLEARDVPRAGGELRAHVRLSGDGGPIDARFVLPVAGGGGLPALRCDPTPESEGRRPRCVIGLGRNVTAAAALADGS